MVQRQGPVSARLGPVRTCVGCRSQSLAAQLLRVVVAADEVVPDPRHRMPGRGAWLHPNLDCLRVAERRRAFPRALRVPGPLDVERVRDYLERTALTDVIGQSGTPEPGGFGITCEISYTKDKPLPATGKELAERCVQDCIRVGLLNEDDRIIASCETDLPYAYVVDDQENPKQVKTIRNWLAMFDIVPAGRFGEWLHDGADHPFIAGKKAAEAMKWMERKSAAAAE